MDLFPLYTDTYPVTRPIRVETSCTIVIFLFSLIVNLKLWKLLRQQKAREHEERLRKQGEAHAAEAEAGFRTEFGVAREKQLWEATYSDSGRNSVVSLAGSRLSTPRGDKRSSLNTLDMMEMDLNDGATASRRRSKRISQGAGITIRLEQIAEDGAGENESMDEQIQSAGHSSRSSTVPPVIPLPASLVADDNAEAKAPGSSSSPPADRRASSGPGSITLCSDDDKVESVSEDDESSLAANLDELEMISITNSSRPSSPRSPVTSEPQTLDPAGDSQPTNRASLALSAAASDADAPTVVRQKSTSSLRSGLPDAEKQDAVSSADSKSARDSALTVGNIKGRLPTRVLKMVKQQKTFEWAKQSTLADTPPLEEIPRPSSPGVSYEMNTENPAAKPDNPGAKEANPKDGDTPERHYSSTTSPASASASSTSVDSLSPVRSSTLPVNVVHPPPAARRVSWNPTSPPLTRPATDVKNPVEARRPTGQPVEAPSAADKGRHAARPARERPLQAYVDGQLHGHAGQRLLALDAEPGWWW